MLFVIGLVLGVSVIWTDAYLTARRVSDRLRQVA